MGSVHQLDQFAARQNGAFNISQARKAGFDRTASNYRLKQGLWIRLDDSVYALASSRDGWSRTLSTALLSRTAAVLTHKTAARLSGLPGFRQTKPALLVPRGSNTRSSIAHIYETDQFNSISTTIIDGYPVTTTPETILVMARDIESREIEKVFDEALIRGLLDLRSMAKTIDREAGRRTPGTPLLRHLTSTRRPGAPTKSVSFLEAHLARILRDPRIPKWTREYDFALDKLTARVDVYIHSSRLVIEADGRNWHTKQRDFEVDRQRDNTLAAGGIQVLRFTYEMLTRDPKRCLDQTVATILHRAA